MRKVAHRLAIAIALVLAAGDDGHAASDEYANIRTVAVISALGNEVETNTLGFMSGADHDLQTDWNLDNEVVAVATKLLVGRFTVKTIAVDSGAFANIESARDAERRIAALPKDNGIDAYIVVFADFSAQVGDQRHAFVVSRDTGPSGIAIASTNYYIGIYDPATAREIDYGSAQYPAPGSIYGKGTPIATCPNAMWAEDPSQLPPDQQAQLRKIFSWLIDKEIGYGLASANLISKSDAAAVSAQNSASPIPACHEGGP